PTELLGPVNDIPERSWRLHPASLGLPSRGCCPPLAESGSGPAKLLETVDRHSPRRQVTPQDGVQKLRQHRVVGEPHASPPSSVSTAVGVSALCALCALASPSGMKCGQCAQCGRSAVAAAASARGLTK